MSDRPVIEPVPIARAPELAALGRAIFTEAYVDDHADDPEGFHAYVRTAFADEEIAGQLAAPGVHYAWVLDDRAPVAYLKVDDLAAPERLSDASGGPLEGLGTGLRVHRLYVRDTHRGAGLGTRLVDHAAEHAHAEGHGHIWLCVWEHNADAIAFYRRLGFLEIGDNPFVIGKATHRDLVMVLPLEGSGRVDAGSVPTQ